MSVVALSAGGPCAYPEDSIMDDSGTAPPSCPTHSKPDAGLLLAQRAPQEPAPASANRFSAPSVRFDFERDLLPVQRAPQPNPPQDSYSFSQIAADLPAPAALPTSWGTVVAPEVFILGVTHGAPLHAPHGIPNTNLALYNLQHGNVTYFGAYTLKRISAPGGAVNLFMSGTKNVFKGDTHSLDANTTAELGPGGAYSTSVARVGLNFFAIPRTDVELGRPGFNGKHSFNLGGLVSVSDIVIVAAPLALAALGFSAPTVGVVAGLGAAFQLTGVKVWMGAGWRMDGPYYGADGATYIDLSGKKVQIDGALQLLPYARKTLPGSAGSPPMLKINDVDASQLRSR